MAPRRYIVIVSNSNWLLTDWVIREHALKTDWKCQDSAWLLFLLFRKRSNLYPLMVHCAHRSCAVLIKTGGVHVMCQNDDKCHVHVDVFLTHTSRKLTRLMEESWKWDYSDGWYSICYNLLQGAFNRCDMYVALPWERLYQCDLI